MQQDYGTRGDEEVILMSIVFDSVIKKAWFYKGLISFVRSSVSNYFRMSCHLM
jgi:hypothetical protein